MFNTENSGNVGISSNSHLTYTTTNSLTAGDIIESNGAILSAFTEVFTENPYLWVPNFTNTQNTTWSRSIVFT